MIDLENVVSNFREFQKYTNCMKKTFRCTVPSSEIYEDVHEKCTAPPYNCQLHNGTYIPQSLKYFYVGKIEASLSRKISSDWITILGAAVTCVLLKRIQFLRKTWFCCESLCNETAAHCNYCDLNCTSRKQIPTYMHFIFLRLTRGQSCVFWQLLKQNVECVNVRFHVINTQNINKKI